MKKILLFLCLLPGISAAQKIQVFNTSGANGKIVTMSGGITIATDGTTTIAGNAPTATLAATATALATPRTINGTSFDGSANITVTAAAGTLTGTTLNATVVTSSLTSVGTIGTGVWQGTAIGDTYISSAATWSSKQAGDADLTTWAGVTPGTGVATALAIAIGSTGAPVLFNGAGGTPSSLALTSATGLPLSTGVTGQLPVGNGGTGLTGGTSGGVLYYSGSTTVASSGVLASNALMVGGGGGVAPSTVTTGTGVLTALGINVGSAGAFVAFNGALGTPSSGVGTALTALQHLTNGTDPDISTEGDISYETDIDQIRGYDGAQQVSLARKIVDIQVTVVAPNDLADSERDALWIWENVSGMSFIVTGWSFKSDTDDTSLNIEEVDNDGANNATVDAVEIATNGTGVFTAADTTITAATIENGHVLVLDFDDTDTPGQVKGVIYGYFSPP